MNTPINFTGTYTAVIPTPAGNVPTIATMPEAGQAGCYGQGLMVTADSGTTAYVAFAPGGRCGPGEPGCLEVLPGQTALITSDVGLWTNQRSKLANVIPGPLGPWAPAFLARWGAAAVAATQAMVLTSPAGGSVTITSGAVGAGNVGLAQVVAPMGTF